MFKWLLSLLNTEHFDNSGNPVPSPVNYFERPERKVLRVFLHCSASSNPGHNDISVMKKWHTDPKPRGRGWSDVGYHIFIRTMGEVQNGRSMERSPAAQKWNNRNTIAICLHGLKEEDFTAHQKKTLIDLCQEIDSEYSGSVTFHGHKEVSNKLCPVFPYREWLNLNKKGAIQYGGNIYG